MGIFIDIVMTDRIVVIEGDAHKLINCDCPCHIEGCEHCLCEPKLNELIDDYQQTWKDLKDK